MPQIAIVEHEALVALDIEKTLTRSGYGVAGPYYDTESFLSALPDAGLDLVLMDISSDSRMSGVTAALESRLRGGPPSVFITELPDAETLTEAKKADPLGILVMPFAERELLAAVELALFRAEMEKRLSYSEKRYRGLFDLSLSLRCISDSKGSILEANEVFREAFLSGGGLRSLPSMFIETGDWNRINASVISGKNIEGEEFTMIDGAGNSVIMLASFSGFSDGVSPALMISAEYFDLSESKRLRDELQQAQKMEAMGRLAGGIAHDFNNILTAIVGHAEMLKLDIPPTDKAYEDVAGIARTAERASKLTKQLLGFSRKQPYSPKPIGISSVVGDMTALLRRLAGEAILFSVFSPKADPLVFADPVQVEQALINLVVNARDALEGKPDARISVVIGEQTLTEARSVGKWLLNPGPYVTLEVGDNGCGIQAAIADKIFEPFFTTKAMGKGTGLGLAIVSSIAQQTHGAVGLETKEGVGTTFTLWFPALKSEALGERREASGTDEPFLQPATEPSLSLKGNPRILLVEDDEALLGFLAYIIAKAGGSVFSARNAGEAMLLGEKRVCDVLVADINLPGLDGTALYERLAVRNPLKCVFITGRLDETMKLPEGTMLLEKPFTPQELISAIGGFLAL